MKIFFRYEDNTDTLCHKQLKITLPKSWKNGHTSKLLGQFVESYNTSDQGAKNPLDASDLHLAIHRAPSSTEGNVIFSTSNDAEAKELWPIASDAITITVFEDREEVYIVHGPARTLGEIEEERKVELERARALKAKTVACVRLGCKNRFSKDAPFPSCSYHSGPPVFHETAKFWSCCPQKKAYDWDDFQAISGCQTGTCTNVDDDDAKSKKAWGGCELREAAAGGADKLKSIEDFNLAHADGGSDAAPVLDRLRQVLEEVGVEGEIFDQVVSGITKECGGEGDKLNAVAKDLGKKLKDAMKAIAVEQLRIK